MIIIKACVVYRLDVVGDTGGRPLYVGMTSAPDARHRAHQRRFPGCAMTIVSRHKSQAAALRAELKATKRLNPTHCRARPLPHFADPRWNQ